MIKTTLYRQLISLAVIICGIIFISLGLLLPKLLLPIYEKNIYQYLKQPLELIESNVDQADFEDVAYLYVVDGKIIVSENLKDIIDIDTKQILDKVNNEYGKFTYLGKTYYYYNIDSEYINKIAITNNDYLLEIRSDIMKTLLPVIIGTLLITIGIIILWANQIVTKIYHLKEKVDNLDNDDYVDKYEYMVDDELSTLNKAIDDMKATLKKQEEYKNQMYQNISHDFKTPLTVIKSHMEAIEDGIMDPQTGGSIIKEQINKLEIKVHSLLYLNKLVYLKDIEKKDEIIDIKPIIESSVDKFKIQRSDVNFAVNISGKTIFNGTVDMWEAIIDNLLNNFMRYAVKEIKITIKNNKITLYNDGPHIDPNILNNIFTPYKKGIKGQFGLGLSIVKKTLNLLGYEITVNNEKKGISFVIK